MSLSPARIVVATRNAKKAREMLQLVAPPWEPGHLRDSLILETLDAHPSAPVVEEDTGTFEGNARKKASETAVALGRWVLADDSGLTVDALNGDPGVDSALYAGTHGDDDANNRKLLAELGDTPDQRRGAAFVCTLALSDPHGNIRLEAQGRCRGRIVGELRGPGGFGYDPLFLIPEYHRTFGELSPLVKSQLSHRARAFAHLRPGLERLLDQIRGT